MTLQERFAALNATTSVKAQEWAKQNKRAKAWHFIFPPLGTFCFAYLGKGEWRRGMTGLATALFDSYAVFVTYAKLWEMQNGLAAEPEPQRSSAQPPGQPPSDSASG